LFCRQRLGVNFDSHLITMSAHISSVRRSGFQASFSYTPTADYPPVADTGGDVPSSRLLWVVAWTTVTHFLPALPTSASITVAFSRHRTSVSSSGLWCSSSRPHHAGPRDTIHWLPVRQRVTFKTAVLVWKCLHDVTSRDLGDLCVPTAATAGRRQSRSSRCLGLSWCSRPGHRLANAALLSVVPESGADYCQSCDCQNCRFLHSSASSAKDPSPTSSSTGVMCAVVCLVGLHTVTICEFGADYKCSDSTQH